MFYWVYYDSPFCNRGIQGDAGSCITIFGNRIGILIRLVLYAEVVNMTTISAKIEFTPKTQLAIN